jgi:hypothetical protein
MPIHVKQFWFDFKLHQSVPRVFWRHFDIWLCEFVFWKTENTSELWKEIKIQISEFSDFL